MAPPLKRIVNWAARDCLKRFYEEALAFELSRRNLQVRRQVSVPIIYKGHPIKKPYVVDLLVDERLIVEVKSTEKHHAVHEAQLLTYLRLMKQPVGLLINFGERYVRNGIRRVANGFEEDSLSASAAQRQTNL